MGNRKKKWTAEEEKALVDGVARHGRGKWKLILNDSSFRPFLSNRDNIDLKDKWRNITAQTLGSGTRSRNPKPKLTPDTPAAAPPPLVNTQTSPVIPVSYEPHINHVKEEPVKDTPDSKNSPRCNNDMTRLIFEALSAAKEKTWMDIGSIASYIEQRIKIEAPQHLRKQVGGRLKRLVNQERLEKGEKNCYRLKSSSLSKTNTATGKVILPGQQLMPGHLKSMELLGLAQTAAYKVAEAEEKTFLASLYAREAGRLSKMQEETEAMLNLAHEIYCRYHGSEILPAA